MSILIEKLSSPAGNQENVPHSKNNKLTKEEHDFVSKAVAIVKQEKHTRHIKKSVFNFGLDTESESGQRVLIEIAKSTAKKYGRITSKYIRNYGIKDEQTRIEIAKLAARKNGMSTSKYIQHYGIKDEQALFEIAKLAIQNGFLGASKYLKNYGFANEEKLIELAKLDLECAEKAGHKGYINIQDFGIKNEIGLIEIAKQIAQINGNRLSLTIKEYGIQDQQALIEIAKLAAGNECGFYLSDYINDFGIKDEKARIEIAMIVAKTHPLNLPRKIQNYGIRDQKALIEIAKIIAVQSGPSISENIKNFGIQDEKARIEIAKLAAKQDGFWTPIYFCNYDITNEEARIEIAKLAAQQSGWGVSANITYFNIQNNKALIEIAKLAAKQDGDGIARNIQKYRISDEKALFEIAVLAIRQNSMGTSKHILNFGIKSKHARKKLSNLIYSQTLAQLRNLTIKDITENFSHPGNVLGHGITSPSSSSKTASPFFAPMKQDHQLSLEHCIDLCCQQFGMSRQELNWICEAMEKAKEPFQQKNLLEWFVSLAALCSMRQDLPQIISQGKILNEISKRDPKLRNELTRALVLLHFNKRQHRWIELQNISEGIVHTELATLLLASFSSEIQEGCKAAITKLKQERIYREGGNQKLLLNTLLDIKKSTLDNKEKGALLAFLFSMDGEERLSVMKLIRDLFAFGKEDNLKKDHSKEQLQTSLQKYFHEKFQVEFSDISSYEATIGSWRKKEALITYSGKLNELKSPENESALGFLKEILTSILDGTFAETRYGTQNNPHLAEINRNHPEIFKKWRSGVELSPEEMEIDATVQTSPLALIKTTLLDGIRNGHVENAFKTYHVLASHIEKDAKNFLEEINTALEPLMGRKLEIEEAEKKKRFMIEKFIVGIFLSEDLEGIEKKLLSLKSLLPKESEFCNDIQGCLNLLLKKTAYSDLTVIDTDNPNDILLMGTEVESSCQRVDGDPELNKCLLGYFLDGKHRLLLIKDKNGQILARSVIRLLIDEKTGKPVLFQEKKYVAGNNSKYSKLLRRIALKKAKAMGVLLAVNESIYELDNCKPYPHRLIAKEKPVPFEYVDALKGIQKGPYSISDTYIII